MEIHGIFHHTVSLLKATPIFVVAFKHQISRKIRGAFSSCTHNFKGWVMAKLYKSVVSCLQFMVLGREVICLQSGSWDLLTPVQSVALNQPLTAMNQSVIIKLYQSKWYLPWINQCLVPNYQPSSNIVNQCLVPNVRISPFFRWKGGSHWSTLSPNNHIGASLGLGVWATSMGHQRLLALASTSQTQSDPYRSYPHAGLVTSAFLHAKFSPCWLSTF